MNTFIKMWTVQKIRIFQFTVEKCLKIITRVAPWLISRWEVEITRCIGISSQIQCFHRPCSRNKLTIIQGIHTMLTVRFKDITRLTCTYSSQIQPRQRQKHSLLYIRTSRYHHITHRMLRKIQRKVKPKWVWNLNPQNRTKMSLSMYQRMTQKWGKLWTLARSY